MVWREFVANPTASNSLRAVWFAKDSEIPNAQLVRRLANSRRIFQRKWECLRSPTPADPSVPLDERVHDFVSKSAKAGIFVSREKIVLIEKESHRRIGDAKALADKRSVREGGLRSPRPESGNQIPL